MRTGNFSCFTTWVFGQHAIFASLLSCAFLIWGFPLPALAALETIELEHTYVMGDADSRIDARNQCLNEAKRRIAEKAGSFVEIMTRSANFQIERDEITSFAAAVLTVEILDEKLSLVGDHLKLWLKVRGTVDPEEVALQLETFKQEHARRMEQAAKKKMTTPVRAPEPAAPQIQPAIYQQPDAPMADVAEPARVKDTPIAQPAVIHMPPARRLSISAAALARKGMGAREIEGMYGRPFVRTTGNGYTGYNYGPFWVVFKDGAVSCVRKNIKGAPDCSGYGYTFVLR